LVLKFRKLRLIPSPQRFYLARHLGAIKVAFN
jgi:hypothetical protein